MSIVKDIVTNFESIIGGLFPEWKRLDYLHFIEKNHNRNDNNRYGVKPMALVVSDGVTRQITRDQTFQVVLVNSYKNKKKNDFAERDAVYDLYEKMDEIASEVHAKKVGLPSSVLLITYEDAEDPEVLDGEDLLVVLRGNFTIKYRKPIN